MGQIYLVRHGQASFGAANYDQLSELGAHQAQRLGEWFSRNEIGFQRVVTGDMERHRQTARGCMGALASGPPEAAWQTDAGFNEYNHEEVLVRHRPDFVDPLAIAQFLKSSDDAKRDFQQMFKDSMARWMSGAHDGDYTETWSAFRLRCIAAFQRLLDSAGASQNIIVFTSGGTIATLCQHLLGLQDAQMADLNWSLVNCAVTKLFYQPGRVSLSYLNNYAHFEHASDRKVVTYR
jgi:broad specificity phosphatase PhoE